MKKYLAIIGMCASLVLALSACASGAAPASSSAAEGASSSAAQESSVPEEASTSEASTGMANPWSDVASAEEAAAGAGVGSFNTPVGMETSLGPVDAEYAVFRCMDGIAEVHVPVAAVEMTIRKGLASAATDGDISGDYNEYAKTWTATVAGKDVTCAGNREGESTKTIWTDGDYCYCIIAQGAGGDTDFGLNAERLEEFVAAVS